MVTYISTTIILHTREKFKRNINGIKMTIKVLEVLSLDE